MAAALPTCLRPCGRLAHQALRVPTCSSRKQTRSVVVKAQTSAVDEQVLGGGRRAAGGGRSPPCVAHGLCSLQARQKLTSSTPIAIDTDMAP